MNSNLGRGLALLLTLLVLTGCSRLSVVYGTADFFIKRYADDYLSLDEAQLAQWEPRLKVALTTHRAEELPYLAGFFEALAKASESGFNGANTSCLTSAFQDLYLRQARIVVSTAAPLLASLTPAQVQTLDRRFALEYEDDRIKPGTRDIARERRKRTDRYIKSIEEWTGPLNITQRTLVADITGRMPDTTEAVLDYRTRKRKRADRTAAHRGRRVGDPALPHRLAGGLPGPAAGPERRRRGTAGAGGGASDPSRRQP